MAKEVLLDADKRAYAKETPYVVSDAPAPCQEVVITDNIDLLKMLPVVHHVKQDASPYITPAGLVQKDPDNGLLNIGVRRHMVSSERYAPDQMGVQIGSQTPRRKNLAEMARTWRRLSDGISAGRRSGDRDPIDLLFTALLDESALQRVRYDGCH